jgi:hypothetical protein
MKPLLSTASASYSGAASLFRRSRRSVFVLKEKSLPDVVNLCCKSRNALSAKIGSE